MWCGGKCCQRNVSPLGKMWTWTRQMSKSIRRYIPSSIYVSFSRVGIMWKPLCFCSSFSLSYYWKDTTKRNVYNCTQFRREDTNCPHDWGSQLWPLSKTDSKYLLGFGGKMDSTSWHLWKMRLCRRKVQWVSYPQVSSPGQETLPHTKGKQDFPLWWFQISHFCFIITSSPFVNI